MMIRRQIGLQIEQLLLGCLAVVVANHGRAAKVEEREPVVSKSGAFDACHVLCGKPSVLCHKSHMIASRSMRIGGLPRSHFSSNQKSTICSQSKGYSGQPGS